MRCHVTGERRFRKGISITLNDFNSLFMQIRRHCLRVFGCADVYHDICQRYMTTKVKKSTDTITDLATLNVTNHGAFCWACIKN